MKVFNILFFLILSGLFIISCRHKPDFGVINDPELNVVTKCSPDTVYFQNEVLPVIISNCAKSGCHDAATAKEEVILDNYQNIVTTGEVYPGRPDESKLYRQITGGGEDLMPPPPDQSLSAEQIALINKWILQGAKNKRCDEINCDTVNVNYQSLKPIVDYNCSGCHSGNNPGGGFDLTSAAGLQVAAQSGKLMPAITWQSQFPMPKGGNKLADCQIKMFSKWIQLNYPVK